MEEIRHGLGALAPEVDIRDYKFKKEKVKMMAPSYPDEYECPIKTEIKDQGRVGSCVAHSGAEILEYHYRDTKMSTNFLYGIHKKLFNSDGPGMFLRECCSIIKKYGDPAYGYCPGNVEVEEVYDIANRTFDDADAMEDAKEHRVASYAKVSSINDIKYALMNYGPVLAAIIWYTENTLTISGILKKAGVFDGGHAIVIRGWDHNGWICQNSWGKNWGRKGYFTLPWDYSLVEAYSLIPGTPSDDIVKPSLWNWLCKLINAMINFFRKVFHI